MNRAALYHRSLDNWCYPMDAHSLHIRLQTAADDVASVTLVAGDPFAWQDRNWVAEPVPLRKAGSDGLHDFWEVFWTPPRKRTRYYFLLKAPGEAWVYSERGVCPDLGGALTDHERHRNAFVFPYIHEADLFRAPDWAASTVWYQIFPERFCNGDRCLSPPGTLPWTRGPVTNQEFYGGDLRGIQQKLPYLADLGITGLYLTPLFASPSVHKYDTTDYLEVDPAFGTAADLRALVTEAHGLGIRVILDAVFNHCGLGFGPWADVVAQGQDSPYAGWFHIHDWSALGQGRGYETFAFARTMPKLNTAHPAVREFLLGVGVKWIQEAGIDGWRLDVSSEVDHEFWRAFRRAVKAVKPEAYLVGEVWHDGQPWLRGDQYDAVMNYRYGSAVSDFVLGGLAAAEDFVRTIDGIDNGYPLPVLRAAFNVLDSHDTDRFLTRCGGDRARARLGWLLLFSLRGAPCVYYGSEVGMEGDHDPDNRRCMVWDPKHQDREQLAFLKSLAALRKAKADLFIWGERQWVWDRNHPDRLRLKITRGDQGLEVSIERHPRRAVWDPPQGRVLLESQGPWAYRITEA